ncbi:MAG: asparaginase [candidate division KSB1 bacterium]|nr:asparaginase [candidate division KSB1 bacterium]
MMTAPAGVIFDAMWHHSEFVAGRHRLDTDLMRALKGRLVAKTGAEGLQCFAIREPQPMGVAIKIADGHSRAVPPVALKLLLYLGGVARTRSAATASLCGAGDPQSPQYPRRAH